MLFRSANDGFLANVIQRIAETDGRCGFAFAGCRRSNGRDEDQLCAGSRFERVQIIQRHLRLEMAIKEKVTGVDAQLPIRHLRDRQHAGFLSDLNVGLRIFVLVVHGILKSEVVNAPVLEFRQLQVAAAS